MTAGTTRRGAVAGVAASAVLATIPTPATASDEDPIFGLIREHERAYAAHEAKREHLRALREKIPAEVLEWPGVPFGNDTSSGQSFPVFIRSEKMAREDFARARQLARPSQLTALDAMEGRVLNEIVEHNRAIVDWYERVGMPFPPDGEDDWWEPHHELFDAAEIAVIEGEPRTLAGLAAKVAYLSRLNAREHGFGVDPGAFGNFGQLSNVTRIAAMGRDAEALLRGGAS